MSKNFKGKTPYFEIVIFQYKRVSCLLSVNALNTLNALTAFNNPLGVAFSASP